MSSRRDRQLTRVAKRVVSCGLKSAGRPLLRRLVVEPLEDRSLLSATLGFVFPLGTDGADCVTGLVVDAQGNELVTGAFSGTLDFDPGPGVANLTASVGSKAFAAKYTPGGALVWAGAFGLESGWWGACSNSIALGPDGSVVLGGYFCGTVDFDPGPGTFELTSTADSSFVCKWDSDGNFLWAKSLGEGAANSVAVGPDGSVHTVGRQYRDADLDPGPGVYPSPGTGFVSKLSDRGDFVWAHGWGDPTSSLAEPQAVAVNGDGRVYCTGRFSHTIDFDPGAGIATLTCNYEDCFVVALDAAGEFVWAVSAGGPGGETATGVALGPDGSLCVTGMFWETADFDPGPGTSNLVSAGGADAFIWKLSAAGSFLWARRFGGAGREGSDLGVDVAVGPDGRVAVTGAVSGTADFGPGTPSATSAGSGDIALLVLDSAGTPLWAGGMGGPENEEGGGVAIAPDGAICIGGYFAVTADFDPSARTELLTSAGSHDGFVCRLVVTPGPDPSPLSKLGDEFRVNNTAPGEQMMPSVAMDASGNFAVAWHTYQDFTYVRRYDAAGNAMGPDMLVAAQETGPGGPDIAMAPDGRFVVAWTNENVDGQGQGIGARLYDAGGTPRGPAFQVTTGVAGDQYGPRVAMDATGGFAVVWESTGEPTGLYLRQFGADGTPLAPPFRLDDLVTTPGNPNYRDTYPGVAVDAAGDGMVVWTNQVSGGWAISARRFSAAGVVGAEFAVATFNTSLVRAVDEAAVAMNASGQAVVSWNQDNPGDDWDYPDIHARRFDAAGAPVGSEFVVNATIRGSQRRSAIALRDDGFVAITWLSLDQDGDGYGVYARVLDAINRPITPEILVPTTTESYQMYADVALDDRGHMVVVWNSGIAPGDNDGSIAGQRFSLMVESGPASTCGLYDPATSLFYLRDQQSGGDADHLFAYGVAGFGWMEVVGDWDGDGIDTPGFYDPATATFYLTNRLEGGDADLLFQFGIAGQGWQPLVGDWNGDGRDGIGLYEPATSFFFFKNNFAAGDADEMVPFGVGGLGWIPIIGDWDGLPGDGFGFYEPAISAFWLKNAHTPGPAEECFQFGMGSLGWTVLAGDWDGLPGDGVGFYVPETGQWFLKNEHAPGPAEVSFTYGIGGAGWRPLIGCWTSQQVTGDALQGEGSRFNVQGSSAVAAAAAAALECGDWSPLSPPPEAAFPNGRGSRAQSGDKSPHSLDPLAVDRLDLAVLAAQQLQPSWDNGDFDFLTGTVDGRWGRKGERRI